MTKERPIIFSAESVRAILDGRKTQTRRVVKQQYDEEGMLPDFDIRQIENNIWKYRYSPDTVVAVEGCDGLIHDRINCPYGVPGHKLWVKETWADIAETSPGNLHYKASATNADLDWFKKNEWKWRNPMSMPRKYSRLTLKIVNVRCERLNDISDDDYHAEGYDSIVTFVETWDKMNSKRGFDWYSNPYVWVLEFKVMKEETE